MATENVLHWYNTNLDSTIPCIRYSATVDATVDATPTPDNDTHVKIPVQSTTDYSWIYLVVLAVIILLGIGWFQVYL